MKSNKSKHEILSTYLKQKNYINNEKFRKSELILSQSVDDFLMDITLKSEITRTNSFSYSNIFGLNGNSNLVDQQFKKLVSFVDSQKSKEIKEDLEQLIPPLLCHLYLEMLKGTEWEPAINFLRKYSVLVGTQNGPLFPKTQSYLKRNGVMDEVQTPENNDQNSPINSSNINSNNNPNMFFELFKELSAVQKLQDIEFNGLVANFRSCKYELKLSLKSLMTLRNFLTKHGHVFILQTLSTWFHIDVSQLQDESENEDSIKVKSSSAKSIQSSRSKGIGSQTNSNSLDTLNNQQHNQIDIKTEPIEIKCEPIDNFKLNKLQESFKQVSEKYHMPIRIFNISNTDNSMCSVNIDKQFCHLAAGFENSKIVLWSLSSYENYGRKPYRMFEDRLCEWSINNCNRFLVDDISDYSSSDEEMAFNGAPDNGGDLDDEPGTSVSNGRKKLKTSKCNFGRNLSLKQQWENYTFKTSTENSFTNSSITLCGHRKAVTDLMFSKYNDVLLSVSRDKTLRVWRADTYTCSSVYRGHNYPIWCVDESPLGTYMATGSKDATARLWSYERKFPVKTYVGHAQDVDCIAFHPNGNYIATGSSDTTIRLWCVTSGKVLRVFTECHLPVNTISFSPDGKYLAAAGDESKIRIFDLAAGSQLMDLKKSHSGPTKHLSWSSNSKNLLSGSNDGFFFVWNINHNFVSSSSSSSNSREPKQEISSPGSNNSLNTSAAQQKQKSHTLQQQNCITGCKRILKLLFDDTGTFINCIGND